MVETKHIRSIWFYLLPLPLMAASLFVGPSDQVSWRHVAQWLWQKGTFWGAAGSADPLVEAVLLAVGLSYFLALTRRGVAIVALILAGIIVSGIFTALLTVVQFLTDHFKLQTIVHWTMGNLHNANWAKVRSALGPILVGSLWLFFLRWRMNVLALGDEETRAVGLHPEREKLLILLPATLIASAAVAVAGVIGMVGLAFPHMVRMMVGPDNRVTTPVAMAFRGSFLLLVDNFSRTAAVFEIPLGILTTLIGGPFFIYLLKKNRMQYPD
jgi:iron complex transport system permease protein